MLLEGGGVVCVYVRAVGCGMQLGLRKRNSRFSLKAWVGARVDWASGGECGGVDRDIAGHCRRALEYQILFGELISF